MTGDLARYIEELGLGEHRAYLLGAARPTIEAITADAPVTKGCSKFGGPPDLPVDFKWPHHRLGPYRFVGQVNLIDVPAEPHGLPGGGLLSFFYAHDEDGESFWGDPDYVRAYWFENPDALQPIEPPAAVRLGSTLTLRFESGADVPPWPWDEPTASAWPLGESQCDTYHELRLRLHPSRRYLLGYPFNSSLAYNPTPGPEWRSLLSLDSDTKLAWEWHDDDWLVTFIEDQRLRAGDFSRIKADAG